MYERFILMFVKRGTSVGSHCETIYTFFFGRSLGCIGGVNVASNEE